MITRPKPKTNALSSKFWEAASNGELAIQRCTACRTWQHPPRPICRACCGIDLAFEPVSGRAKLWSWTTTRHNVVAGFEDALPYTCLMVELVEQDGIFLLSDLIGRDVGELRIGMAMRVVFPHGPEPVLPQFEPAGDDT